MKKKLGVLLFLLILMGLPAAAFAADQFDISKTSALTFKTFRNDEPLYLVMDSDWGLFKSVTSSNEDVVSAWITGDEDKVVVEAEGLGSATIKVTDENAKSKEIKVTVTTDYIAGKLKDETSIFYFHYGSKKIVIEGPAGMTGTLKIGKDTYKVSMGASEEKKIRLKRRYKLNEKITLKLKWKGISFTKKTRISSATNTWSVRKDGRSLKVECWNTHKGDRIIVKHRGKTYTQTVPKDYDQKGRMFTFRTKKSIRSNNEKIEVIIRNKDKKKLDRYKFILKNGKDRIDEDDLDD